MTILFLIVAVISACFAFAWWDRLQKERTEKQKAAGWDDWELENFHTSWKDRLKTGIALMWVMWVGGPATLGLAFKGLGWLVETLGPDRLFQIIYAFGLLLVAAGVILIGIVIWTGRKKGKQQ